MNHFRFVTVVWGADFTETFLKVCLPSQLFPKNLLYFSKYTESVYRIYTTAKDAKAIKKSSAYRELASIMPVELAVIRGISYLGRYNLQTQCHAHFVQSAKDEDCAFVFLVPDVFWADGAFARLLEISKSGKRMVAIGSPRLAKEAFVSALLKQYGKDGMLRPINSRQLVQLSLDYLHPNTILQLWDKKKNTGIIPGNFYWPINKEGLLIRAFHLHPLMARPIDRNAIPTVTIDADYTLKICSNPADVYVVEDSDDMCAIDLTSAVQVQRPIMPDGQWAEAIANWVKVCTHAMHREFVKRKIRFHWNDCSEKWREVEQQSDNVVEAVMSLVEENCNTNVLSPLPKLRYLSPRFLVDKLRWLGPGGFLKMVCSKLVFPIMRRIYGPNIKITVLADE